MKHIVLLGDSIFDNSTYVGSNEQDVPNQLKTLLNDDLWDCCLYDGDASLG